MTPVSFRNDIQGLRAIAVLSVMVFHFNPEFLPGGFVGVDIFLVISGFLITSILLKKRSDAGYKFVNVLNYFLVSRFRRIVPAYMVVLIAVVFLASIFFLNQDFIVFKEGFKKAAYFSSNNYFAQFGDYFAPENYEQPLLHTWSLAVEMQFYFLAPFLFLLLPKRILGPLLLVLIIGLSLLAEYRLRILGFEQKTYYSLYARLPEFFVGALAGWYLAHRETIRSNTAQALGFIGILLAVVFQPKLGAFPGLSALLPALATGVMLITRPSRLIYGLLSCKTMLWLGATSYSLYLWHWPVLAFLRYYTGVEILDVQYSLLFILLTLACASASYHWVEIPLRSPSRHGCGHRKFGFLAACGGIAAMMLGTAWGAKKLNSYLAPPSLSVAYMDYADPTTICHGQIVGECLMGDLTSKKEILVLGDSHAAMLNHFFDRLGEEIGFRARIITASSCVTIPGFDSDRIHDYARQPCLKQIEYAKKYLATATTIFLAGAWDRQLESVAFQEALKRFLRKQNDLGKKIYLMAQVPRLSINPFRYIRFQSLGLRPKIKLDDKYIQANLWIHGIAETFPAATNLNFEQTGLFAQAPFYHGELLYMDGHHLNEIGAVHYSAVARSAFQKIMD